MRVENGEPIPSKFDDLPLHDAALKRLEFDWEARTFSIWLSVFLLSFLRLRLMRLQKRKSLGSAMGRALGLKPPRQVELAGAAERARTRTGACYTPRITYEALLDEALALPEDQRAALVQKLNATLAPSGVEEAWAAEVARRVDELRSGGAETIPADVAFARAREALRSSRG